MKSTRTPKWRHLRPGVWSVARRYTQGTTAFMGNLKPTTPPLNFPPHPTCVGSQNIGRMQGPQGPPRHLGSPDTQINPCIPRPPLPLCPIAAPISKYSGGAEPSESLSPAGSQVIGLTPWGLTWAHLRHPSTFCRMVTHLAGWPSVDTSCKPSIRLRSGRDGGI